jgi:hypothetical protein
MLLLKVLQLPMLFDVSMFYPAPGTCQDNSLQLLHPSEAPNPPPLPVALAPAAAAPCVWSLQPTTRSGRGCRTCASAPGMPTCACKPVAPTAAHP